MNPTHLTEMINQCSPVRGQRLAKWLERFLLAHPDQLSRWNGTFTEVMTAKTVHIFRKRGVVEEYEVNRSHYDCFVNAAYRAPVFEVAKIQHQKEAETGEQKPEGDTESDGSPQSETPDGMEGLAALFGGGGENP
jgi:hypothetical protein